MEPLKFSGDDHLNEFSAHGQITPILVISYKLCCSSWFFLETKPFIKDSEKIVIPMYAKICHVNVKNFLTKKLCNHISTLFESAKRIEESEARHL